MEETPTDRWTVWKTRRVESGTLDQAAAAAAAAVAAAASAAASDVNAIRERADDGSIELTTTRREY